VFLSEATVALIRCQVRSKTVSPCSRLAAVDIQGVAFCEACAREQEAYFAIGELTQEEETQDSRSKQLAEALERIRWERTYGCNGIVAEMHHGVPDVNGTERLALAKS
jgi:predicted Fe-S protein YdhL (DUF1289 family)